MGKRKSKFGQGLTRSQETGKVPWSQKASKGPRAKEPGNWSKRPGSQQARRDRDPVRGQ